jgi:hypothetical protein
MLGLAFIYKACIFNINLLTWWPIGWTSYVFLTYFHYVHIFNLSQLWSFNGYLLFYVHTFNLLKLKPLGDH